MFSIWSGSSSSLKITTSPSPLFGNALDQSSSRPNRRGRVFRCVNPLCRKASSCRPTLWYVSLRIPSILIVSSCSIWDQDAGLSSHCLFCLFRLFRVFCLFHLFLISSCRNLALVLDCHL